MWLDDAEAVQDPIVMRQARESPPQEKPRATVHRVGSKRGAVRAALSRQRRDEDGDEDEDNVPVGGRKLPPAVPSRGSGGRGWTGNNSRSALSHHHARGDAGGPASSISAFAVVTLNRFTSPSIAPIRFGQSAAPRHDDDDDELDEADRGSEETPPFGREELARASTAPSGAFVESEGDDDDDDESDDVASDDGSGNDDDDDENGADAPPPRLNAPPGGGGGGGPIRAANEGDAMRNGSSSVDSFWRSPFGQHSTGGTAAALPRLIIGGGQQGGIGATTASPSFAYSPKRIKIPFDPSRVSDPVPRVPIVDHMVTEYHRAAAPLGPTHTRGGGAGHLNALVPSLVPSRFGVVIGVSSSIGGTAVPGPPQVGSPQATPTTTVKASSHRATMKPFGNRADVAVIGDTVSLPLGALFKRPPALAPPLALVVGGRPSSVAAAAGVGLTGISSSSSSPLLGLLVPSPAVSASAMIRPPPSQLLCGTTTETAVKRCGPLLDPRAVVDNLFYQLDSSASHSISSASSSGETAAGKTTVTDTAAAAGRRSRTTTTLQCLSASPLRDAGDFYRTADVWLGRAAHSRSVTSVGKDGPLMGGSKPPPPPSSPPRETAAAREELRRIAARRSVAEESQERRPRDAALAAGTAAAGSIRNPPGSALANLLDLTTSEDAERHLDISRQAATEFSFLCKKLSEFNDVVLRYVCLAAMPLLRTSPSGAGSPAMGSIAYCPAAGGSSSSSSAGGHVLLFHSPRHHHHHPPLPQVASAATDRRAKRQPMASFIDGSGGSAEASLEASPFSSPRGARGVGAAGPSGSPRNRTTIGSVTPPGAAAAFYTGETTPPPQSSPGAGGGGVQEAVNLASRELSRAYRAVLEVIIAQITEVPALL